MSTVRDMIALKGALRTEIRQRLRATSAEDLQSRSQIIRDRVLHLNVWKQAKSIVFFSPLPNEPDIAVLAQLAAANAKTVATIPSTARVEADFELQEKSDLIFVPGLAFSQDGHRLGRGAGFSTDCWPAAPQRRSRSGSVFHFNWSTPFQPSVMTSKWT